MDQDLRRAGQRRHRRGRRPAELRHRRWDAPSGQSSCCTWSSRHHRLPASPAGARWNGPDRRHLVLGGHVQGGRQPHRRPDARPTPSLYFLDWEGALDSSAPGAAWQISNATTGAVLSTESISSFQSGVYLDYQVSGNLVITITRTAGVNAVLSGLFLDPTPTPTPTATASFVKQDSTTQGNWIKPYGRPGQRRDRRRALPACLSYATVTPSGQSSTYTWSSSTTDVRATAGPRRHGLDRRHLVLGGHVQGGRQPDPDGQDARPRALLPRLGGTSPDGPSRRRSAMPTTGRRAEHSSGVDLVVPEVEVCTWTTRSVATS